MTIAEKVNRFIDAETTSGLVGVWKRNRAAIIAAVVSALVSGAFVALLAFRLPH